MRYLIIVSIARVVVNSMRSTNLPRPSHTLIRGISNHSLPVDGDLDTPDITDAGSVASIGSEYGSWLGPGVYRYLEGCAGIKGWYEGCEQWRGNQSILVGEACRSEFANGY